MVGYHWFKVNQVSGMEYMLAKSLLMTGPKATPPTFRAVRKMIGRLRRGDKPGTHGYGSWRAAKSISHAGDVDVVQPSTNVGSETLAD